MHNKKVEKVKKVNAELLQLMGEWAEKAERMNKGRLHHSRYLSSAEFGDEEPAPPKQRGRPKGSKNTDVAAPDEGSQSSGKRSRGEKSSQEVLHLRAKVSRLEAQLGDAKSASEDTITRESHRSTVAGLERIVSDLRSDLKTERHDNQELRERITKYTEQLNAAEAVFKEKARRIKSEATFKGFLVAQGYSKGEQGANISDLLNTSASPADSHIPGTQRSQPEP